MRCPLCLADTAQPHAIVAGRQQYQCTHKACKALFFNDNASEYGPAYSHGIEQNKPVPTLPPTNNAVSRVQFVKDLEKASKAKSNLIAGKLVGDLKGAYMETNFERPHPPVPGLGVRNVDIKAWYEKNRDAITVDAKTMGLVPTLELWRIPPARWDRLKSDFGLEGDLPPYNKRPEFYPRRIGRTIMDEKTTDKQVETTVVATDELINLKKELADFKSKAQETTKVLMDKLDIIDTTVGDLVNRGYMNGELKIDIIQAVLHSNLWTDEREKARKILAIIQSIEGI